MIAQYLAIAAAKALAGIPPGGGGGKIPLPGLQGAPSELQGAVALKWSSQHRRRARS